MNSVIGRIKTALFNGEVERGLSDMQMQMTVLGSSVSFVNLHPTAFNESEKLQEALIKYHERTGRWPKRVLVDQIYRTRANIAFCKEYGIRISGPKLGRRSKDEKQQQADKKTAYKDNTDLIGIESASVSASGATEWA